MKRVALFILTVMVSAGCCYNQGSYEAAFEREKQKIESGLHVGDSRQDAERFLKQRGFDTSGFAGNDRLSGERNLRPCLEILGTQGIRANVLLDENGLVRSIEVTKMVSAP